MRCFGFSLSRSFSPFSCWPVSQPLCPTPGPERLPPCCWALIYLYSLQKEGVCVVESVHPHHSAGSTARSSHPAPPRGERERQFLPAIN